jgi:hypothetical protein
MSKPQPPQHQPSAQQRPQQPPPERKPKPKPAPGGLRAAWRWLISAAIVFHMAGVFVAPWYLGLRTGEGFALPPRDSMGRTIPPDQVRPDQLRFEPPWLIDWLWFKFRHYDNLLFINHGYEFFSPDPVWNHLLQYEVYDAAGQKVGEGRMPDRRYQWPRLFYHRHMMLVEQSLDLPGSELEIADQLCDKHGGERVHLELIRHHLLTPQQVLDGVKLDDPRTYEVVREMDHRRRPKREPSDPGTEPIRIPGARP